MRRRLDLALALVHEPEVLFLDEPTTGLDPISRLTLWEEVRRLNRESGTTVFLTTQYLEEADQLAGRVGIIDGGRIVAEGTPGGAEGPGRRPDPEPDAGAPRGRGRRRGGAAAARRARCPRAPGMPRRAPARRRGALPAVGAGPRRRRAWTVAGLDLALPTLDDVFVAKTGRRLEAEGAEGPAGAPAPSAA